MTAKRALAKIYSAVFFLSLCAFFYSALPAISANEQRLQEISSRYMDDWIFVSSADPGQPIHQLIFVGKEPEVPVGLFLLLQKAGSEVKRVTYANEAEAARLVAAQPYSYSVLLAGRKASSPALATIFTEPQRTFVVGVTEGAYHFADFANGTMYPVDQYVDNAIKPNERILIFNGYLSPTKNRLAAVYLDETVERSELPNLLALVDSTFLEVLPLTGNESDFRGGKSGGASAIVTTGAELNSESIVAAIGPIRRLKMRRIGDIAGFSEITDEIQNPSNIDVGAKQLRLLSKGDVGVTSVPLSSDPETPMQRANGAKDYSSYFRDHEANECELIQHSSDRKSERVALVIGTGSYHPKIGWLESPVDDALATGEALLSLGFDIFLLTEGTAEAVRACAERVFFEFKGADVAALYFSGHGVQINDENFMVPVDAQPGLVSDSSMVSISYLMNGLRKISRSTLVFLDACRNNPFEGSSGNGLAAIGIQTEGDFIDPATNEFAVVYATSPDSVASEGRKGHLSPFTEALVQQLGETGMSLQEVLVNVSASVGRATDWAQTPFTRSTLSRVLYLNGSVTFDELIASSKSKAEEAENKLYAADLKGAIQLALESIPKDISEYEARTYFSHSVRALEFLNFLQMIDIDGSEAKTVSGSVGQNWKYAIVASANEAVEKASIVDVETGSIVAEVPLSSEGPYYFGPSSIADTQDGSMVAVPNGQGSIFVLDLKSKNFKQLILVEADLDNQYRYQIRFMEFDRTASKLLVHTESQGVFVFDTENGELIRRFDTISLPSGEFNIIRAGRSAEFRFLDDGRICFMASRRQSVNSPRAGDWTFLAIGKMDLSSSKIDDLLWTNTRWQHLTFDCANTGEFALLNGRVLEEDKEYSHIETPHSFLIDAESGSSIVSHDANAYFSADSRRALFASSDRVALYDLKKQQFIPFRLTAELAAWVNPSAPVALSGKISSESYVESVTVSPRFFELDIPFEELIDRTLRKLEPAIVEEIKNSQPLLPSR